MSTPESWLGEGEGGKRGTVTGERGEGRRNVSLGENTSGNFIALHSPPACVSRSVISSESLRSTKYQTKRYSKLHSMIA